MLCKAEGVPTLSLSELQTNNKQLQPEIFF